MSSGIAALEADFKGPNTTAEGDFVLLSLQTARFLMKSLSAAKRGEPLSGLAACLGPLSKPDFSPMMHGKTLLHLPEHPTQEQYLDFNNLVKLFELRSLVAIARAGQVLEAAQHSMSSHQAWNHSARQLYTATKCHVRYFIISKFAAVIKETKDISCKSALSRLCCLFGLCDILEGEQWNSIILDIEPVEAAVSTLCLALRPDVVALTDAFEFPDRVLNSAIGKFNGAPYEALYEAAKESSINKNAVEGVPTFMYALKPYLDLELLKDANEKLPDSKL